VGVNEYLLKIIVVKKGN